LRVKQLHCFVNDLKETGSFIKFRKFNQNVQGKKVNLTFLTLINPLKYIIDNLIKRSFNFWKIYISKHSTEKFNKIRICIFDFYCLLYNIKEFNVDYLVFKTFQIFYYIYQMKKLLLILKEAEIVC